MSIDLATGRKAHGELQVASWLGDNSQRPFNWRYQLSAASGGFIKRKGEFDLKLRLTGTEQARKFAFIQGSNATFWSSKAT
jgi:hypothetical protein